METWNSIKATAKGQNSPVLLDSTWATVSGKFPIYSESRTSVTETNQNNKLRRMKY